MGSTTTRNGGFYSFLGWANVGDNIDSYIKSLNKNIVMYFISFFEINERTLWLDAYIVWDSQVIVV